MWRQMSAAGAVLLAAGGLAACSSSSPAKLATEPGTVRVVLGTGTPGPLRAGPGTASPIFSPVALAADDNGDLFVALTGSTASVVKLSAGGEVTPFAGTAGSGLSPVQLGRAVDAADVDFAEIDAMTVDRLGDLFVATSGSSTETVVDRVTPAGKLTTLAGPGTKGYPGPQQGPANASFIPTPLAMATDGRDDVYCLLKNGFVIQVSPTGALTVVAGDGSTKPAHNGPAGGHPIGVMSTMTVTADGSVLLAGPTQSDRITTSGMLDQHATRLFSAGVQKADGANDTFAMALSTNGDLSYLNSPPTFNGALIERLTTAGQTRRLISLPFSSSDDVSTPPSPSVALGRTAPDEEFALAAGPAGLLWFSKKNTPIVAVFTPNTRTGP